ncbi:MAG: hypothetical protein D084_Lepto4C00447G0006 [Leptospirillum sp. Group IV 'UBA BS']|nr:MAG: hypothetical protein D084_Lepto4C00447G0006 [Leptospirillum sp. Group IV 'UBA BS']
MILGAMDGFWRSVRAMSPKAAPIRAWANVLSRKAARSWAVQVFTRPNASRTRTERERPARRAFSTIRA